MSETFGSVHEVRRFLWQADCYPCIGNEDWRAANQTRSEAFAKAATAVGSHDDPLGCATYLPRFDVFQTSLEEVEGIYVAMDEYFGCEGTLRAI
jgi:hypothetical protein